MSILDSLTLTAAPKSKAVTPEARLRQKVASGIDLQIKAATAEANGELFRHTVLRWRQVEGSDRREQVEEPVRFKRWWWLDGAGVVHIQLLYAHKPIEIKAGKSAIVAGTLDKLIPTLERLKEAVLTGELDKPLSAAAAARAKQLKRSPPTKSAR